MSATQSTVKISVIIPTLNEEKVLYDCLQSLQQLDYPKDALEIIIVDNGSTDGTRKIAGNFNTTVHKIPNITVAGLRNFGALQANGELLAFIDADCTVAPNWLRQACKYYDRSSIIAWGSPPRVPEKATWIQNTWYIVRKKRLPVQEVDWLESMNLFIRKRDFIDAGGFNETLITCEDVDLCYRLKKSGRIISDESIWATHFGEAATLKSFWQKEVWRGRSNLSGLKSHGLTLQEIPSLILPIYFSIIAPLAIIFSVLKCSLIGAAIFWFIPGMLVLFKTGYGKIKWNFINAGRLFLLLQIYFLARTLAMLKTEQNREQDA